MLLHRLEYIIWLFLVVWRRFSWQWPHKRAAFFFSCLCSQLNTLTSSFGRVFYASHLRKQDQRTKKQQAIWNKSLHKTKLDVCATSNNGYTDSSAHIIALWNLYVLNGMNLILVIMNASDGANTSGAKWENQRAKSWWKAIRREGYQRSLWSERVCMFADMHVAC